MNSCEGSLKNFYGYKETFGAEAVWVDIPRDIKFVHTNPYDDDFGDEDAVGGAEISGRPQHLADLATLAQFASSHDESKPAFASTHHAISQAAYGPYATQGLEALSAVASQDHYSVHSELPRPAHSTQGEQVNPYQPTTSLHHNNATQSQHGHLDFILNPSSVMTPTETNIDPTLHSASSLDTGQLQYQQPQQHNATDVRPSSYTSTFGRPRLLSKGTHCRRPAIDEPKFAFLLRDFSERAGLWMDLFDLNQFFASKVPVLAVRCPLLLYSCAALSAKSLARVDGRKPVMGGQVTIARQSRLEHWPGAAPTTEGWVRRAREYYDLAVSLLRQALAGATRPPTSSLPDEASPDTITTAQAEPLPGTDSDELVAATAVLCIYEFLDASGPEWSRHLDGAKSLFDIAKDHMVPLTLPPSPVSMAQQIAQRLAGLHSPPRGLSQGRRAIFWNFARQDMLAAFINNTLTRLDTTDLGMWRSAGLKLTPEGFVCPSNLRHPEYTKDKSMADDLISNALIWILMKLVNFIVGGDDVTEAASPLGISVRQHELFEYWEGLDEQLRVWYEGIPESFHATAVRLTDTAVGIEEKWFPRAMCASTMQSYHFARIQLLHHKPHLPPAGPYTDAGTSLAARHASYASILQQSRAHAKEIVAIGLGRSDEGTRIHSVQPLWTAGLVLGSSEDQEVGLETETWRRSILSQLRGIERDMGWASEYRVQSLLKLWELPAEWGKMEAR
ncbi:hypothetical protein LTR08_003881 [Meristemomyces frigidus]|nr:hypothetical protein LTR08_003881 [Meristemomyces frigidus]